MLLKLLAAPLTLLKVGVGSIVPCDVLGEMYLEGGVRWEEEFLDALEGDVECLMAGGGEGGVGDNVLGD